MKEQTGVPGAERTPRRVLSNRFRLIVVAVGICSLSLGIAIGAILRGVAGAGPQAGRDNFTPVAPHAVDSGLRDNRLSISNSPASPDGMSAIFSRVAAQVEPSVVHIKVTIGEERQGGLVRGGTGSGVIVNPSGFIITNQHVAGAASKITVKLADGTEFPARVIGQDKLTDLAVIKIEPRAPLPAARMGNSDRLNVGDWVLAIGSPFGLEQTVTAGIISAKDRFADSRTQSAFQQFLQTDAAINPGNSGGPLVNLSGEVVGINTQIATMSGMYNGIGFAMPSSTAVDVYNQLVTNGRVRRAYLGIETAPLTPPIAHLNRIADNQGVVVAAVLGDDSPALRGGLQSGDVIISINGQRIRDPRELIRLVASLDVGSLAGIAYLRGGVERKASVRLEERKEESEPQINQLPPPFDPRNPRGLRPGDTDPDGDSRKRTLGINVKPLTPELARQHGLEGVAGVFVFSVDLTGAAEEAGVRAQDVIIEINYRAVAAVEDFNKLTRGLKSGDDVVIKVLRRDRGPLRRAEIIAFTMP